MSKISIYDVVPVPKLADKLIGTSVGGEPEDLTYNFTLGELLNLFIPNIPGNTLQGVLDFGNTATQNINLTGTINTTNLNVSGTLTISDSDFTGETHILGGLYDSLNSIGTPGQVLISTGTNVEWFTIPTVIPNLQQVLASGNTAVNNIILTGNLSANNAALLTSTISTSLTLLGTLRDGLSSVGANNQVLSSTVTGVRWVNLPVYSAASPLLYNSGTGVFSIQQANASQGGFLSAADWITFDGKQTAINLTTTGNSGPSTLVGSTINVPNYTLAGLNGVPQTRILSINGVAYNLSQDRSWTISAGVSSVTATSPLFSTGGATPNISIQQSSSSLDGYLSNVDWLIFNDKQDALTFSSPLVNTAGTVSIPAATSSVSGYLTNTDWSIFNSKQGALTLTTTGTSGPSTLVGDTLNIPQYTDAFVGTVTSVAALTLGTSGTDLSSTVANSTTTPVITLNVPTASAVNRGALSAADWATFNSKQPAGNYITSLTGEATATGPGAAAVTLDNTAVIGKVLTGLNVTGGTVVSTDNILTAFGKVQNQINGLIGGSIFQGTWNASTNTPTLTSGVGTNGYYYIVSVAGTTNLDGITDWQIGDWAIFAGTSWEKVDNTDAVSSVNGYTGTVSLVTGDVLEGAGTLPGRPSQLYFTDARSRAAISLTTTGTGGASTYNSTTGVFNIPNYTTDLTGYVPYTGANQTVNLNTQQLQAGHATFTTNGTTDTLTVNHTSGSGYGIIVTKGGSNEALYVSKTSGSGNAMTVVGGRTSLVDLALSSVTNTVGDFLTISGGVVHKRTAAEVRTDIGAQSTITLTTTGTSGAATFVANTLNIPNYGSALTGYVPYTGATTNVDLGDFVLTSGGLNVDSLGGNGGALNLRQATSFSTWSGAPFTSIYATTGNRVVFSFSNDNRTFTLDGSIVSASSPRTFTFPDASGTLALVGGAGVGTVTSVSFSLGSSGTDLSASVANSTTTPAITLNVPTASATNRGALSAADWTTFNSKQPAGNYVTLDTTQTITALKTILRSGDVLNFKIGTDTLYGLKIAYNQNEIVPAGEATWSFVNTFNNGSGTGLETTPISFFRGVLVTGERLLSVSVNTNLLDYYGNNPSGRYPIYAYNTGVQQFASSIIVGETTGVVNAATGAIADLPAGVVANFKGRVIGSDAVNNNEFATLGQVTSGSRAAISLTTTGTSGPATYSSVTGVLNIPEYQGGVTSFNTRTGAVTLTSSDVTTALGFNPVTDARTLSINGVTYDLTANRSWTVGVNPSSREIETFIATSLQTVFTVTGGYTVGLVDVFINGVRLTSSDYTATNGTTVVLTVGTMAGNIVDIIKYTSGIVNSISGTGTTNELAYFTASTTIASLTTATYPSLTELSYVKGVTSSIQTQLNGKQAAGTYVTSVTGTSPIVSSGGTTPAISIPVATTSVNGYLSSTDWTTFNNKASTAALAAYLPLAGGTLTGALGGTSAVFSSSVTANGLTLLNGGGTYLNYFVSTFLIGRIGNVDTNDMYYDSTFGGNHYFRTGTGGTTTPTTKFTILQGGNIGIGTVNPAGKLEVNGLTFINNTGDSTARLLLRNSTTGASSGGLDIQEIGVDASLNNASNGYLSLSTNNAERMRITSGGSINFNGTDATTQYYFGYNRPTATNLLVNGGNNNKIRIQNVESDVVVLNSNGNSFFNGGNVGINMSSPNEKLHVAGAIAATGTATTSIPSSSTMDYFSGATRFISRGTNNSTRGAYRFLLESADSSSSIDALNITSGGNLRLFITPAIDTNIEWFQTPTGNLVQAKIWANGLPTLNAQVGGSGGVYLASGGTSWISASDERLKTDLIPIEDAINKVATLRSVIGRYITDEEKIRRSFLIAQDVQKVLPEAVVTNPKNGELGLSYTELIPLLVASIKELKAELDELKSKN
jgi:hypothetical protein